MKAIAEITGYAASEPKARRLTVQKRPIGPLGPHEVLLKVLACGVCHSDLHLIDDDWGISRYPLVPGHEILGEVVAGGERVDTLRPGTRVGVGWQHGACLECDECVSARDNMCDRKTATCVHGWGGYADYHVADSRYCFPMPEGTATPEFAPLLCGGVTVFSPLDRFLSAPGQRAQAAVGIVGLGGLGHLAVKFARAMGTEVTVFSSSESKREEATLLGAHHFVASRDAAAIAAQGRRFDLVLVTAPVPLPWEAYVRTLRADGTLCFVGAVAAPITVSVDALMAKRARVTASPIGSRADVRRMLEFSRLHGIQATCERFAMADVDTALARVRENRVRHRAVLVN